MSNIVFNDNISCGSEEFKKIFGQVGTLDKDSLELPLIRIGNFLHINKLYRMGINPNKLQNYHLILGGYTKPIEFDTRLPNRDCHCLIIRNIIDPESTPSKRVYLCSYVSNFCEVIWCEVLRKLILPEFNGIVKNRYDLISNDIEYVMKLSLCKLLGIDIYDLAAWNETRKVMSIIAYTSAKLRFKTLLFIATFQRLPAAVTWLKWYKESLITILKYRQELGPH